MIPTYSKWPVEKVDLLSILRSSEELLDACVLMNSYSGPVARGKSLHITTLHTVLKSFTLPPRANHRMVNLVILVHLSLPSPNESTKMSG